MVVKTWWYMDRGLNYIKWLNLPQQIRQFENKQIQPIFLSDSMNYRISKNHHPKYYCKMASFYIHTYHFPHHAARKHTLSRKNVSLQQQCRQNSVLCWSQHKMLWEKLLANTACCGLWTNVCHHFYVGLV